MNYEMLPDGYLKLIYDAIQKVAPKYHRIATSGTNEISYRERVYCYELYHWMRTLEENKCDSGYYGSNVADETIVINGEIDKAGHCIIDSNFNPDFVIHRQGTMDNNLCVVEVKVKKSERGIKKDFGTISCMLSCYEYEYGIFIYVGKNANNVIGAIKEIFREKSNNPLRERVEEKLNDIYVYISETAGQKPEIYTIQEILSEEH